MGGLSAIHAFEMEGRGGEEEEVEWGGEKFLFHPTKEIRNAYRGKLTLFPPCVLEKQSLVSSHRMFDGIE